MADAIRSLRGNLREWKARCRRDEPIPHEAIAKHRLNQWFMFMPVKDKPGMYLAFAEATGEVVTEWVNYDPVTRTNDGHLYRREPNGEYVRITPDG